MRKHRRTKSYRKIAVALLAVAAVGVPAVAMACGGDGQEGRHQQHKSPSHWKHPSWGGQWTKGGARATPTATPTTAKPSAPVAKAPTAAPTASTPSTGSTVTGPAATVVKLVNAERAKAGCTALTVNAKLTKAAQAHSADMAAHTNMSHTGSDGSSPGQRITAAGYNWSTYGENVAYGYSTPQAVMDAWMTSPGHKANILNCSFKEIGVGLAQPGSYWTQDFGASR